MTERQVLVKIKNGLHARPAGQLVKELSKFKSNIEFIVRDRTINPKSILNLMSIAIRENELITIRASGEDEMEALQFVEEYLQNETI